MKSKWRKVVRAVIAQVVFDNPDSSESELRKRISAAYPFGERAYHPYKIWLSEVKNYFTPGKITQHKIKPIKPNEGQLSLL